jgi:hypothetical protein
VSYRSAVGAVPATATCAPSTAQGSNPGRITLQRVERQRRRDGNAAGVVAAACFGRPEQEDSKIEQQPHAGPFAGPKPEPMTVPRGASRSNRRAHPSRLRWARGFLPSWSCEFDSRHSLQIIAPSQRAFTALKLFEHGDDKNNQAGHLFFMIIGARPPYAPCQAGFHQLRIGWSQS